MDPATITLLAGLSAGALICLTLLYISIPYPAPVDIDAPRLQRAGFPVQMDVDGPSAAERWAA